MTDDAPRGETDDAPRLNVDGYEPTDAWTETAFDAPYLTVTAHNVVYEEPTVRARFEPVMPRDVDQSPRALFATGLSFSRPPPGDRTTEALLGIAAKFARREFESDLERDGLRDVRGAGTRTLRLSGGQRAEAFAFDAAYPLVGADGQREELPVRVWAAIWPTPDSFAMAGGIVPTGTQSLPGTDETVEATPDADRRRVFEAVRDAAR